LEKDFCLAGKRLRTLRNGSWHKVLEKEAGLCCAEEREVWREDDILRVEGRAFQVHLEVH
jgi:alkylated DNA nucleotide flippase Atl1